MFLLTDSSTFRTQFSTVKFMADGYADLHGDLPTALNFAALEFIAIPFH